MVEKVVGYMLIVLKYVLVCLLLVAVSKLAARVAFVVEAYIIRVFFIPVCCFVLVYLLTCKYVCEMYVHRDLVRWTWS